MEIENIVACSHQATTSSLRPILAWGLHAFPRVWTRINLLIHEYFTLPKKCARLMSYGQTVHAKTRIVLGQTRCRKCDWEVWCGFHHGTGENLHTRCRRHGLQLIWLTQKILDTGSWSRHGTIWVQGKTNCGYGKHTDAKLASLSTGNAVAVTRIRSQDCSIYLPNGILRCVARTIGGLFRSDRRRQVDSKQIADLLPWAKQWASNGLVCAFSEKVYRSVKNSWNGGSYDGAVRQIPYEWKLKRHTIIT